MRGCVAGIFFSLPLGSADLARAQERITITAYAGAHFSDRDRFTLLESGTVESDIEDGPIVGLRMAVPIRSGWSAEFSYGWTTFEVQYRGGTIEDPEGILIATDGYDLHQLELGLRWSALAGRTMSPFVTLAPGLAVVTFDSEFLEMETGKVTKTEPTIGLGGGLVWRASEALGIRADVRDHIRFCGDLCLEDETLHGLELSGGVEIRL